MLNFVLILQRRWRAENAQKLSSQCLVHGIGAKLVSNCKQSMSYNKSLQIFCRKKMPMLTGSKVSSLACKCVNFTDQNIIQRGEGPYGTEFWRSWNAEMNIPTDRAQRVDGKNGVICLIIIFTPQVMVIKMSKTAHFLYFCWCQRKISHSLYIIFMCIWKILYSSLRKCYRLLDSELLLARYQPL